MNNIDAINGSLVLLDLMQVTSIKNEDGMPVIKNIDKPNGGSVAYVRHDAMVNKINTLIKEYRLFKAEQKPIIVDGEEYETVNDLIDCLKSEIQGYRQVIKELTSEQKQSAVLPLHLDSPFSTKDILTILIKGCEYLLTVKDYDGADYEEMNICVNLGKRLIQWLDETPQKQLSNEEIEALAEKEYPYDDMICHSIQDRYRRDFIKGYRAATK